MKTKPIVFLLCMVCLMLGGCTRPVRPPAAQSNRAVFVSLDTPNNGGIFVENRTIALRGFAPVTNERSRIISHIFLANGNSIEASPSLLYEPTFRANWTPSRAGEYYLQAKVTLEDGSIAVSEPHRICVMPADTWVLTYVSDGYMGPCELPARNPNHAASGDVTASAVAAPSTILFSRSCPSYPSVTFIATVNDPQDLVGFVDVALINIDNTAGVESYAIQSHYLNWITTRTDPVIQKEYRATIPLRRDLFTAVHLTQSIDWLLHVYDRNGRFLVGPEGKLRVQPLQCSQQRLEISTSTPEVLIIAPDCPPGTYYAPVTNKCIQIQIDPSKKPKDGEGQPGSQPPICLKAACPP